MTVDANLIVTERAGRPAGAIDGAPERRALARGGRAAAPPDGAHRRGRRRCAPRSSTGCRRRPRSSPCPPTTCARARAVRIRPSRQRATALMLIQLQVALTHLTRRRRQTLVSLTGVVLGVAFFLAVSSLMRGSEQDFIKRLVDNSPHITVSDEFAGPGPSRPSCAGRTARSGSATSSRRPRRAASAATARSSRSSRRSRGCGSRRCWSARRC